MYGPGLTINFRPAIKVGPGTGRNFWSKTRKNPTQPENYTWKLTRPRFGSGSGQKIQPDGRVGHGPNGKKKHNRPNLTWPKLDPIRWMIRSTRNRGWKREFGGLSKIENLVESQLEYILLFTRTFRVLCAPYHDNIIDIDVAKNRIGCASEVSIFCSIREMWLQLSHELQVQVAHSTHMYKFEVLSWASEVWTSYTGMCSSIGAH